jgi:hypothetical protein
LIISELISQAGTKDRFAIEALLVAETISRSFQGYRTGVDALTLFDEVIKTMPHFAEATDYLNIFESATTIPIAFWAYLLDLQHGNYPTLTRLSASVARSSLADIFTNGQLQFLKTGSQLSAVRTSDQLESDQAYR